MSKLEEVKNENRVYERSEYTYEQWDQIEQFPDEHYDLSRSIDPCLSVREIRVIRLKLEAKANYEYDLQKEANKKEREEKERVVQEDNAIRAEEYMKLKVAL